MGSSLMSFSIGLWMYQATGSAMMFAATLIFNRLPGIFVLPFAGTLADRVDRRKLLIGSNMCSAIVTFVLATLVVTNKATTAMIYLSVSALSITNAFQRPAYLASVAQITPKRYLGQANGMVQLAISTSDILAPALGGFLIVIMDLSTIIFLNLASFLLCMVTLLVIRFPNTLYHIDEETFLQQMSGGWKFILKRKSFIALVVYFAVANLMLGIANVLITPLVYTLDVTDYTVVIGLVTSATGIGGLLGGILMSLWGGTKRRSEGMIEFGFLIGLGYMIMGSIPVIGVIIVGVFLYGISMSLVNSHWQTLIQSKVRAELLARVFAINQLFVLPTIPLGYFIGGKLSEHIFKPLFAQNEKAVETFGWLVGTGETRGIALLFLIIGTCTLLWSLLCFHYKPLRYMDDILPDAVAGAVLIRDRDQLQREEDYQLEQIKAREISTTSKKTKSSRRIYGKIQYNDSIKQ
jgi:MFS family permease